MSLWGSLLWPPAGGLEAEHRVSEVVELLDLGACGEQLQLAGCDRLLDPVLLDICTAGLREHAGIRQGLDLIVDGPTGGELHPAAEEEDPHIIVAVLFEALGHYQSRDRPRRVVTDNQEGYLCLAHLRLLGWGSFFCVQTNPSTNLAG